MASLKDLRDRIASIKATKKITKAMQVVAAARLRRAQEAVVAARPYSERITNILINICSELQNEDIPYIITGNGRSERQLVIVCTADRGLCGSFNTQIIRSARTFIEKKLEEKKQIKILTIGKKGDYILNRDFGYLIIDHINLREVKQICFSHASVISKKIISLFHAEEFDVCTIFYSYFHSMIRQQPISKQLVPLDFRKSEAENKATSGIYEYEPNAVYILDNLGIKNLAMQIFRALLENIAGEMGAKMSAMDNATRNANEIINKLSITYNRQRQAQITTELIEIIAGAEAL